LEYDNVKGKTPTMVHISGDIFAIAYSGDGDDGWLKTVTINSSGVITDTGNSLEFDTDKGKTPKMIHISGDVYAIVYSGSGDDGWLTTVTIDSSGVVSDMGNSLEFDTAMGKTPTILSIGGDVYAIVYSGFGDDGWLKTITIDSG
jgi:hypothetical protein